MKRTLKSSVMMVALLACSIARSQERQPQEPQPGGQFDLGLSYTAKVAKISDAESNFVLKGGALDGVYWLGSHFKATGFKDLGVAFDLSGETASNIEPNVNLNQISFVAGPRYRFRPLGDPKKNGPRLYAQALFGFVHGSHGVFPVPPASIEDSASSFAVQIGGGLNWPVKGRLGVRVFELDSLFTHLPNLDNNKQADFRASTGITWRLGK
jgi:hypothetical protein